jgi:hypothetical protein
VSHYLYLSEDVDPSWIKVGVRITPYSAVRAYQRNTSREIAIQHLYFGRPRHIKQIEKLVKKHFKSISGATLLKKGQTELFKISAESLVEFINAIVSRNELHVKKIQLSEPYTATNSGSCPLGLPSEDDAASILALKVDRIWGQDPCLSHWATLFEEL